jgi:hypothetical protein
MTTLVREAAGPSTSYPVTRAMLSSLLFEDWP